MYIHKEFYRLLDTTLELTKAAVLMECLDSGMVSQHAGKDLSTIPNVENDDQEDVENEPQDTAESEDGSQDEHETQEADVEESPERRRYSSRFTAEQTKRLNDLLDAHYTWRGAQD